MSINLFKKTKLLLTDECRPEDISEREFVEEVTISLICIAVVGFLTYKIFNTDPAMWSELAEILKCY